MLAHRTFPFHRGDYEEGGVWREDCCGLVWGFCWREERQNNYIDVILCAPEEVGKRRQGRE